MIIEPIYIVTIILLIAYIVLQRSKVIICLRQRLQMEKDINKERDATADILNLSKEVIADSEQEKSFLPQFVKYAQRTLKATGAAVMQVRDDGLFNGIAVAGIFPPLRSVTPQVKQQLMAHEKKHTEMFCRMKSTFTASDIDELCSEKGFAFFYNTSPIWFPEDFVQEAPRILIAPIRVASKITGCIIVTSKDDFDSHRLTEQDGRYLIRLAEIASLTLEVINVFRERQEYKDQLQSAREDGMMQVSTGIIHNIGNAITVAKLSVIELQEKIAHKREERPETLVLEEMLPTLRSKVKDGTIKEFFTADEIGRQYLDIAQELMVHREQSLDDASAQLKSLSDKLFHISEIIELQQRFVGELGTENMTQMGNVIESAIKIFEETFNKRGIKISTEISHSAPEVLIDSSMMTQVFMNMLKNAVEAIDIENDHSKTYQLSICLKEEEIDSVPMLVVEIGDNGPGMTPDVRDKIFNFGFSTKGGGISRGFGLHSCMDTVKKYNGKIFVESELKKGTHFRVCIPANPRA